jgi:hypothetical protein
MDKLTGTAAKRLEVRPAGSHGVIIDSTTFGDDSDIEVQVLQTDEVRSELLAAVLGGPGAWS